MCPGDVVWAPRLTDSSLFWLTDEKTRRLQSFFPKIHDKLHVDEVHVLSGIIFTNRNNLLWHDTPKEWVAEDAL